MASPGTATVLVVDDDEAVADVYARQLSDRYAVETAYDGETALEKVTEDVDVVLLDRRMHRLSGREVLETTRERGLTCGVVMVTAVDPGFDIVDMGFDDYLLKPVEREQLEQVVKGTIERLSHEEATREYLSLASKVATLRLEKSAAELEASEEYAALLDRLRDLKEEVDTDAVDPPVDI